MKINKITYQINTKKILKSIKYAAVLLPFLTGIQKTNAQIASLGQDVYQTQDTLISPKGTNITSILQAPNSTIRVGDRTCCASIVVDITNNVLYLYDNLGLPQKAYKIASGKASTPTNEGIKKIINIEQYPYKYAPESSKRHRHPQDYGPKLLLLCPVDTQNGELLPNDGQFIHGTNNPASIGKYASKGCIRMDNTAIKEVVSYIQKGQFVSIIK